MTGKTYMIGQVAERLKLPFYKYSCSRDSSVHDLLGYKQPKSETYLETAFLNAYENGGIFLVDEYDAMSGDMALFFNGIADSSKFISIPHRDSKPQAEKHPDFYLVMCGNTWGKGSTDYSGRDFQDLALMDRFRFCRHHIGYHMDLEKDLMGTKYSFATTLRQALEDIGSYLSTRNIEDISKLIASGKSLQIIVDMLTHDLTEEERKVINNKMRSITKTTSRKPADIVVEANGNKYSLEKLIQDFPPKDTRKISLLRKQNPNVYKEYKSALVEFGITI